MRTPGPPGRRSSSIRPGEGAKFRCGVFGVDAALDGVADLRDVFLLEAQLFAGGDADLFLDQIDAGDLLGDGMLDLDAGVDFEEVEVLFFDRRGIRRCRRWCSRRL